MQFPDELATERTRAMDAVRNKFGTLPPELRRTVFYHMGWTDAEGRAVDRPGSKGVRPTAVLLATKAAGGDTFQQSVNAAAVAVEALHNCSFMLDDIMDGDEKRRGRQTAWRTFSVGQAILASIGLLTLAVQTLAEASAPSSTAVSAFLSSVQKMVVGQSMDLDLAAPNLPSLDDSYRMSDLKTGTLMALAFTLGPRLAGADDDRLSLLEEAGRQLGLAFQARDDLVGIWGAPSEAGGRIPAFDLTAGKGTPPVAVALADPSVSEELGALLANAPLSPDQTLRAIELVNRTDAEAKIVAFTSECLTRCRVALDDLGMPPHLRGQFEQLVAMGEPTFERAVAL